MKIKFLLSSGIKIPVDRKNSIFIPEQIKERPIIPLFENNKRWSAQGKNLWSNFFH